jgi:hypothetical protein
MRQLLRRLWYLTHRQRAEADLAEEMALHRELKEQELQERGTKPTEAKLAARRALGSMTLARDEARDVWICRWLQDALADLRWAVRLLMKNPGSSLVAVLTLALAIGIGTVIASVIDVARHLIPADRPNDLVFVSSTSPQLEQARAGVAGLRACE